IGIGIHEARRHAPGLSAEERPLRIPRLEMLRDLPGVENGRVAVLDDRHLRLPREGDRRLVGDLDRAALERKALVRERHARAPRVEAVAPAAGAAQLVEDDRRHGSLLDYAAHSSPEHSPWRGWQP